MIQQNIETSHTTKFASASVKTIDCLGLWYASAAPFSKYFSKMFIRIWFIHSYDLDDALVFIHMQVESRKCQILQALVYLYKMVEPDPWKIIETNQLNTNDASSDSTSNPVDSIPSTFEDNFQPESTPPLADSQEYLQALGAYFFFFHFCTWNFWLHFLPSTLTPRHRLP